MQYENKDQKKYRKFKYWNGFYKETVKAECEDKNYQKICKIAYMIVINYSQRGAHCSGWLGRIARSDMMNS